MQHASADKGRTSNDAATRQTESKPHPRGAHSRPLPEKKPDNVSAPQVSDASKNDDARPVRSANHSRRVQTKNTNVASPASTTTTQAKPTSTAKPGLTEKGFIIPAEKEDANTSPIEAASPTTNIKQHQLFKENPNIHYMNGESLSRPMTLPQSAKIGVGIIVALAVIIGTVLFFLYFDKIAIDPAKEQAKIEQNLSKEVSLDLPPMLSLLEMDDAGIDATLKETGATFFEKSPVGSGEDYSIVKLPAELSLVDAAAYYAQGVSNLTAAQAIELLNGSWVFDSSRSNGVNMALHYADFKSGNLDNAISNAIAEEELDRGHVTDSGDNDGYGNQFTTGTIMINGTSYSWTVSAVPLSKVYSQTGMPEDAAYVGIRIKSA